MPIHHAKNEKRETQPNSEGRASRPLEHLGKGNHHKRVGTKKKTQKGSVTSLKGEPSVRPFLRKNGRARRKGEKNGENAKHPREKQCWEKR